MEVSESIVCLQLDVEYNGSALLVQQDLPAKLDLENCYSFNVVFSSDTSMYRFTGKRVSHDRFAQCIAVLSHGVRPRWFSFEGRLFAGSFKGPARIVDSLIVPRKTPWEQP